MPNKKFQVPINLVNLNADPATGSEGDMYFNTTLLQIRSYINGAWRSMASGTSTTTDATQVHLYVKNGTSNTLPKGSVVYINGSDGTNITVALAQANMEGLSSKTLGFLETDLAPNSGTGYVATDGVLSGIDTNIAGANAGDPIWLSPTVAGGVIYGLANKPSAPNHLVYLGVMTKKSAASGEIFIHVQNGFELYELHNVSLDAEASIADNEVLAYDSATTLWKNQTASEAGLAALSGATFTGPINGTSLTLSGDLTINGTTTTINSTTLTVDDKNIEIGAVDSPTNTTADGGGILLKGTTDKSFNWVNFTSSWTSSENIDLASGKTFKIATNNVLSSSTVLGITPTINSTGFSLSGGTTPVAVTFAGGSAYTISGTNSQSYTLPSNGGTLVNTGQTFYIGSTPITVSQGTGTATSISGLTALNASTSSTTSPFTISSSIATSNSTGGTISISSTASANAAVNAPTGSAINISSTASATSLKDSTGGAISISSSASGVGAALGGNISISTTASSNGTAGSLSLSSAGGFTITSNNLVGTIDNFNIGATTAGTGRFTTVTATSSFSGSGANLNSIPVTAITGTASTRTDIVNSQMQSLTAIDILPRSLVSTTRSLTAGTIYLNGFIPVNNFSLSTLTFWVRTYTSTASLSAALCTISGSTATVVAVSDVTTVTSTGQKTISWTTAGTQTLTAGTQYVIALLCTGTAVGVIGAAGGGTDIYVAQMSTLSPFLYAQSSTTSYSAIPAAGGTIAANTSNGISTVPYYRLT